MDLIGNQCRQRVAIGPTAFFLHLTLLRAGCSLHLLPYSFAMGKLSRPVFGFEIVDGTTFVCHGGCGFVCTRSCHARNHARVCSSLKEVKKAAATATRFKCSECTFSTVHRANLSKHVKMMHVHLVVHLCKCGKLCAGETADGGENAPAV